MANLIITTVIFGILAFLTHVLGGGDFVRGLTAKKENHTRVITEPMFTGKTVNANLVLINDNEFAITKPSLKCVITGRNGVNMKTITKVLDDVKIEAKGQVKLNNFRITIVRDFPGKLECHISKFSANNI